MKTTMVASFSAGLHFNTPFKVDASNKFPHTELERKTLSNLYQIFTKADQSGYKSFPKCSMYWYIYLHLVDFYGKSIGKYIPAP